jgi:predicted DNA-binding transcriptional regulator AlpA
VTAREVKAVVWREGRRWRGRLEAPGARTLTAAGHAACVARLRREAGGRTRVVVETIPELVGVSEAVEIMGWDKRRVFTYIDRDSFPEPVALLASGRVWRKVDVEAYAREWKRKRRKSEGPPRKAAPRAQSRSRR